MGAQEQLRIDSRREADRVVISLDGELDMANAPLLQRAIEAPDLKDTKTVVLDLQGLTFLDSTGLRIILSAREQCWRRGQEFAVTPGSQQVQRLLSVTGVGEHLRTLASADEVLA
ncbi:MAG TPA: STAS domain-containing protein [Solirubrobacteraceae bacterium]|jgi:anti-sigma B factor antagonist|nr:STAS domain-containing protein [Solirubrobacteraceae bacterium]